MQSGQSAMRSAWTEKGLKQACQCTSFAQALAVSSIKRCTGVVCKRVQHWDGHIIWQAVILL